MKRSYFGDVEGQMNLHGAEDLEMNCYWVNDPLDGEYPHELQGHLAGFHPQRRVLGGEAHLLAIPIASCGRVTMVGRGCEVTHRTKESRMSREPG